MNPLSLANTLIPLSAAITALVIVSLNILYDRNKTTPTIWILWLYFASATINWGSIILYFIFPDVFVVMNSFVLFTFIMAQILFYAFLFHLTRLDSEERFPRAHLVLPIAISLLLTGLMLITPLESQRLSVTGRGEFAGGSYLFFVVSNAKMPIRLAFSVVYTGLSFLRLYSYQKRVTDYSANYYKSSLGWVQVCLFLSLSLIPIPLMGILLPRETAVGSWLLTAQNIIVVFQYSFLCFHITKHNYIQLDELTPTEENLVHIPHTSNSNDSPAVMLGGNEAQPVRRKLLSKCDFEEYMQSKRPYLNPDLRLLDIAADLNTNRTYISTFINSVYGVNFSRLVNRFRLQELNQLRQSDATRHKSDKELAEMVGFGSYRNYRRFIAQESEEA
ncbi:MAG: hypothetical protein RBT74_17185 [Tenuifilaceae bacterium]|jgi:AraC-like DNA-binding protein|nr:hypothetical protein [Tenuifilaceae bacterium]